MKPLLTLGACRRWLLLAGLFTAFSCAAQKKDEDRRPPLGPAEAKQLGQALVTELLTRRPPENATNTGVVRIRDPHGVKTETKVTFIVYVTPTNWVSVYETRPVGHPERAERLTVIHHDQGQNEYAIARLAPSPGADPISMPLGGVQLMTSFAGSDFWLADLGLEFLHWPDPRLLKKDMRKSRAADVLEARNPHPSPGGYSRVVAWIDTESGGVLHADAYDIKGERIKEFDPTSIKNHELAEMEMRNLRTESTTWIKFDVEGK